MTAKKAARAVDKFPELAEKRVLKNIPRIIIRDTITRIEIDSSGIIESVTAANRIAARTEAYMDSMKKSIDQLSAGARDICADFLLINDALIADNKTLSRIISEMKPVKVTERKEIWYEDTLRLKQMGMISAELKTFKDKAKGNYTLYFPKWLFILIIIVGGLVLFTRIKTGGFNLLKLIGKPN
jgi:hypothetical protein